MEIQDAAEASRDPEIAREPPLRRSFAIISHPDAGKTTLTEKLLLYSGAIELAGSVRRKGQQRHARSDWLEMEQARGISVTSTVLQFGYEGRRFNLLDTGFIPRLLVQRHGRLLALNWTRFSAGQRKSIRLQACRSNHNAKREILLRRPAITRSNKGAPHVESNHQPTY